MHVTVKLLQHINAHVANTSAPIHIVHGVLKRTRETRKPSEEWKMRYNIYIFRGAEGYRREN